MLVLTARDEIADTVTGLDLGADDYVTKPFVFEELLARVRARLRAGGGDAGEAMTLDVGGIHLDVRTRRAEAGGEVVDLTAKEFALLETFLRHPGQVLSREQLLSHVWGYDYDPGSNIVDVYVGYLRRKLGQERFETDPRDGLPAAARRLGQAVGGAGREREERRAHLRERRAVERRREQAGADDLRERLAGRS